MYTADTIAAISTPLGEGGIGIIRISGPQSISILDKIFKPAKNGGFESHRFYYGEIVDPATSLHLDEVMVVYMQSPRSFTREDVVEIQCHGGSLLIQQLLSLVLLAGARLAEPGEFTRRAFLNGRIDLLQAESIIDIIRAKTESAATLAQQQRDGSLSRKLFSIRDDLRQVLALVEAYVDFPDEELEQKDESVIADLAAAALSQIEQLASTYAEGKVLRDGVSVIIAGKPNVGKSSLLNTLLKEKRAIVTSIPGTTRDLIEEVVNIRGLPVTLLDTAGICITCDPVEQEGIRLAIDRIPTADLVLFLLDSSRPFDDDDRLVLTSLSAAKFIPVLNKSDLEPLLQLPPELLDLSPVRIATHNGTGIEELKDLIASTFLHGRASDNRDLAILSRARHRDSISAASDALCRFKASLANGLPPEILALDLREALDSLGRITGETTPDDILDLIFGQFCIGK